MSAFDPKRTFGQRDACERRTSRGDLLDPLRLFQRNSDRRFIALVGRLPIDRLVTINKAATTDLVRVGLLTVREGLGISTHHTVRL